MMKNGQLVNKKGGRETTQRLQQEANQARLKQQAFRVIEQEIEERERALKVLEVKLIETSRVTSPRTTTSQFSSFLCHYQFGIGHRLLFRAMKSGHQLSACAFA